MHKLYARDACSLTCLIAMPKYSYVILYSFFSCLPVSVKNETGIEVKIKHDRRVHSGYCVKNCTVSI